MALEDNMAGVKPEKKWRLQQRNKNKWSPGQRTSWPADVRVGLRDISAG